MPGVALMNGSSTLPSIAFFLPAYPLQLRLLPTIYNSTLAISSQLSLGHSSTEGASYDHSTSLSGLLSLSAFLYVLRIVRFPLLVCNIRDNNEKPFKKTHRFDVTRLPCSLQFGLLVCQGLTYDDSPLAFILLSTVLFLGP